MGHQSWIFIGCVLLGGLLLTLAALPGAGVLAPATWLAFATLTAFATFTRLYKTLFQSKQHVDTGALSYSPTLVFLFAGIFLLPPVLFPMLVISAYTVEWAKERWQKSPIFRAWYIQPFNMATHVLAATAARWVYGAMQLPSSVGFSPSLLFAAILAALVYVGVNHLLIGQALVLARNVSWAETGVWQAENLQPDLIMLALGYAMALLWQLNPWFIVLALSPLVLIYQAIKVPQLKKDAQTDGKTGLLNASYFNKLFAAALERALQTNQPLAFIMVDLDLLRNINNTYGHLAGDRVLAGVGRLIREAIRADDLAGRFGGEEFMIVLPGAGQAEALALAERLRRAVEATGFAPANSPTPIVATISLGLACFPEQGRTLLSLTHAADLAVYQAKLTGRNRVVSAGDIPHSITLESIPGAAPAVSEAPTVLSSPLQPEGAPATVPNAPAVPIVDASGAPPPRLSMAALDLSALPQQPTTPPPPAHAPSRVLGLFLSIVIGTGLVLALLGIAFSPPLDWVGVGLLMALAVICEYLQVNVYGDNTASVSIAIIFAAALITGVPGVLLVSAAVTLTHYLRMHPPAVRTVFFNWAIHVIAGSATVLIMHTLPFDLQITNLLLLLVPASGAAMAAYFLETGLVASAIHLSTGASLVGTWRAQFQWLAGHYLVLCLLGLFLAIAQGALGPVGVIVFTLPVLMMRYAQQQYVERTRESMRELKRMNEELAHANREIMTASRSIRQLNDELFQTLAKILDSAGSVCGRPCRAGGAVCQPDWPGAGSSRRAVGDLMPGWVLARYRQDRHFGASAA